MLKRWLPDPKERTHFKRWAVAALALHLIAALCTEGWYALDEHWQILEFANAILGRTPRGELAWEYAARLRPSLQPFMYAGVERVLLGAGVSNPFEMAAIFRALTTLAAWSATMLAGLAGLTWFPSSPARRWVMPALTLAWFLPYLHARTSSENASETAFVLAFALLTLKPKLTTNTALTVGFLLGLACELRYQVGFMVAGALLWCLIIARLRMVTLASMAAGLIAAIGLGTVADRVFYGEWTLAPWNYFRVNLIEHKAISYGSAPWWSYFRLMLEKIGPPLSVLMMAGVAAAWIRRPRSLATWSMVPFLLVHMVLGHKEFRFLYPLATLSVLVTVRSLDDARQAWPAAWASLSGSRWAQALIIVLMVEDVGLLGVASLRSAQASMPLYRHIYDLVQGPTTIYFHKEQPYLFPPDLQPRFYRPPNLSMVEVGDYGQLEVTLDRGDAWFIGKGFDLPSEAGSLMKTCVPEARTMPTWVRQVNINHWVDRTPVWTLYRCPARTQAQAG